MTDTEAEILRHVATERGSLTAETIMADFACLHAAHPRGVVAYTASQVDAALKSLEAAGKVVKRLEGREWHWGSVKAGGAVVATEKPKKRVVETQGKMF